MVVDIKIHGEISAYTILPKCNYVSTLGNLLILFTISVPERNNYIIISIYHFNAIHIPDFFP